jgi:hypothetical protein
MLYDKPQSFSGSPVPFQDTLVPAGSDQACTCFLNQPGNLLRFRSGDQDQTLRRRTQESLTLSTTLQPSCDFPSLWYSRILLSSALLLEGACLPSLLFPMCVEYAR